MGLRWISTLSGDQKALYEFGEARECSEKRTGVGGPTAVTPVREVPERAARRSVMTVRNTLGIQQCWAPGSSRGCSGPFCAGVGGWLIRVVLGVRWPVCA